MPTGSLSDMQAEYAALYGRATVSVFYTQYSTASDTPGMVATADVIQTDPAYLSRSWSLRAPGDIPNVASSDFEAAFPGAIGSVYAGGSGARGTLVQAGTFYGGLGRRAATDIVYVASSGNVSNMNVVQADPAAAVINWVFTSAVASTALTTTFPEAIEVISL